MSTRSIKLTQAQQNLLNTTRTVGVVGVSGKGLLVSFTEGLDVQVEIKGFKPTEAKVGATLTLDQDGKITTDESDWIVPATKHTAGCKASASIHASKSRV